jgi:hypothetical protein
MATAAATAIPVRPGTELELPNIKDLAVTPGGAHFLGTTPGGSRIIYDRNTLMHYRRSPLSKTPPAGFPVIPGVTAPAESMPEGIPEGDEGCSSPMGGERGDDQDMEGAAELGDEDDVFPMES